MENPVEILYSWQALIVAITAAGLTQLVKTIYDIVIGQMAAKRAAQEKATYRDKPMKVGKAVRQSSPWLNRVVFPIIPILLGALIGALVPLRPEVLVEYASTHIEDWFWQHTVFALWGAACGQFADYVFSKAKAMVRAFVDSRSDDGPLSGPEDEA